MQMGYWDGNRFVIPGLPQAAPPSVTQPPQGIIPQAAPVQSPVQQFQRPQPFNHTGRGEDNGSDAPQPTNPYSGGLNYGENLGAIGLVSGIPGAGPLGAAIGTAIDTRQANETLGQFVGSIPHEQVSYLKGLLNNATFGWLGESTAGQAMDNIESHPDVQRQAAAEAQIALDAFGGGGDQQYGNTGTGAPSPEPGGAYGYDPDGGVSQGMWADGGFVTKDRLVGPDPEGPDDGYGGLDEGEAVIPTKMVDRYGEDVMQALIDGDIDPKRLRALL
jgi:hypothetical protein